MRLFQYALATLAVALHAAAEPPDQIRGVNLGGWLVTEEWITPSVYSHSSAEDEWHLCQDLGSKKCLSRLKHHWSTFYTRDDFVDIKKAGLNAVRIPLGYWAVDLRHYEPYVSGQYPYLIRAVNWAHELGLSVLIDLHGAPGSQNAQENSGLEDELLFPTNSSNADRSVKVLSNLTQEFSRAAVYGDTVIAIELLNEPRMLDGKFSISELKDFYSRATSAVRSVATYDKNSDLNVTIHDAFQGPDFWVNYDSTDSHATKPQDHLSVDTHQYFAFEPRNNLTDHEMLDYICNMSQTLKRPMSESGLPPTLVGEWSLAVGSGPTLAGSSVNSQASQIQRTWFRLFFESQAAAYSPNGPGQASIGWMFWCWKMEHDVDTWSYRLGIEEEYIPADVSNASQFVFPLLDNGCIDFGNTRSNYTAPPTVPKPDSGGLRLGVSLWQLFCLAVAVIGISQLI